MSNDDLRADARANRERLLEVARDALIADPAVSLNAIAKTAGVGAGTLYRHFASREALVIGVYRSEIEALATLAPALLAEHVPQEALRRWCDRLAVFGRTKHGVADVFHAANSDQDFRVTYGPMLDALRRLIRACEASGDLRPGLGAEDFLLLVSFLWRLPTDAAGEGRAKALLAIVFDGLRPERATTGETDTRRRSLSKEDDE